MASDPAAARTDAEQRMTATTADELARLRRIERAARALLEGIGTVTPRDKEWLPAPMRQSDLTELRAALAAEREARRECLRGEPVRPREPAINPA